MSKGPSLATGLMCYILVACLIVLALSVAGRMGARRAARHALASQNSQDAFWRLDCLAARMLVPSVLAVIAFLLAAATQTSPSNSPQGWVLGFGSGILASYVFQELGDSRASYWQECTRSLRKALPTFPDGIHKAHGTNSLDCQALTFNSWFTKLLDRDERPEILKNIFTADPHLD